MNLSELMRRYGDDKIAVQKLDDCATSLNVSKGVTKITFLTEEPLEIGGTDRLGLVVWLDREEVAKIIAAEKTGKPSHVVGWRDMSTAPRDGTHILATLYREASEDMDGRKWPAFSEIREIWFKPYSQFGMELPWHAGDPFDSHDDMPSDHFGEAVPIAWQPLPEAKNG